MKTSNLKFLFGFAIMLLFICSCKGEAKTDNTSTSSAITEAGDDQNKGQAFIEDDGSQPNVLQIGIGSPDHTTLVAAVQSAGLENALVNAGPLMVFAPTNAAFDALPPGTVEDLLKPENKDALAHILKHHVTAGNYNMDLLKKIKKLGQASDLSTTVEVKGEDIYIGGAKILGSIDAGNGTVYVVDKVILPPSK